MAKQGLGLQACGKTDPENERYQSKNLAIVERTISILKEKGWTKEMLAEKMGESESEINELLSGLQDLTLKRITKLETVLEKDIVTIPPNKEHPSFGTNDKKEVIGGYMSSMISPSAKKNAPYMGAFPNKWVSPRRE